MDPKQRRGRWELSQKWKPAGDYLSPAAFVFGKAQLSSWIPKGLAPRSTTSGRVIPARVARIGAVDVALALRIGIAVVELPIYQPHMRVLRDRGVENCPRLVPANSATAKCRRRLNSSCPS